MPPVWRPPRLIALIEEAAVINRILRHLGVPTEMPAPRPARAPPLCVGVGEADDDSLGVRALFLTILSNGPPVGGARR